jgi:hypothetical protein
VSAARKSIQVLETLGLPIFVPVVRLIARESPREQFKQLGILLGVPVLAFFAFLLLWSAVAQTIVTKYGTLPAPAQVWTEAGNLLSAHAHTQAERRRFAEARAAEVAFASRRRRRRAPSSRNCSRKRACSRPAPGKRWTSATRAARRTSIRS